MYTPNVALFWDILLIVGGIAILVFANRMFNRSDSEDWLAKIIWGLVIFGGISTAVLGVIATDERLTHPPAPPEPLTQGQPSAPRSFAAPPGTRMPQNPANAPVQNPMNATVKVQVVDSYSGQAIPQAQVRLSYGPSQIFVGVADSTGTATFLSQPVGVNASITVEKYTLVDDLAPHTWHEGANTLTCKVSATSPPAQPAPDTSQDVPPDPNSNPYPNSNPSTQNDPSGTPQPTDPSSPQPPADPGQRNTTAGAGSSSP
jgi:hypothetical protein